MTPSETFSEGLGVDPDQIFRREFLAVHEPDLIFIKQAAGKPLHE
jgi:hypothetical protein